MNAQDLEQRARELLAAEYERDGKAGAADHIRTQPLLPNKARAVRAVAAALRQQAAPVDLEQFREAVEFMQMRGTREQCIRAGDMLQAIIDNAGKVEVEPSAVRSLVAAANAVLALYPGDDLLWTLESAVRPFNATKPAECAKECPP